MTQRKASKNAGRPIIIAHRANIRITNNTVILHGICLVKIVSDRHTQTNAIRALINNNNYPISFAFKHGIKLVHQYRINRFSISIPLDDLATFDIQNRISLVNATNEHAKRGHIYFNLFDRHAGKYRHSKLHFHNGTSLYLRQSVTNTMYLTIRQRNFLDTRKGALLILLTKALSTVTPQKDIILLFEKECERYQESASVLYEKLRNNGYNNVYYIINKSATDFENIPDNLLDNIIQKHSFKHLYYFFKCKKFIGTETIGHSIQLRCANRLVINKEHKKDLRYVFLQHGVMYMVSLNSSMRSGFRSESNPYKLYRIVVSSKAEANHFIELGGCDKSNLYITGLPKFDKAYANKNADKIIIMPTWRRWETNQARIDYRHTKYYKFIKRIISAIPENLKNKVVVLPHPLIAKELLSSRNYKKYLLGDNFSYDKMLRDCRLLITDYSSIAYDAFYRGANIIFDWSEKDECMQQYGDGTYLLLNKHNAFGDVVYSEDAGLTKSIQKLYSSKQSYKYVQRYRKIVEFHDNHNTGRLIKCLQEDKVI